MVMRSDSISMTSSQTDRLGDLTLMCMKKNSNKNTKRLKLTSKLTGQGKEPRIWGRLTEMQWTRYVKYVMWNNPSDDNYIMIPQTCTTALLHYCTTASGLYHIHEFIFGLSKWSYLWVWPSRWCLYFPPAQYIGLASVQEQICEQASYTLHHINRVKLYTENSDMAGLRDILRGGGLAVPPRLR